MLGNLLEQQELLSALARFSLPHLSRFFPGFSRGLIRRQLAKRTARMHSVADFQSEMVRYFKRMLRDTTSGLTCSGLEHLDSQRGYLFISNHRDIALDSSCLNYVLYESGLHTARSAIGDNLTEVPYVEDLLRLNKSFKIRRNVKGVKKAYAAMSTTSRYIRHSLEEPHSIWLAQREGRSKDGFDRTDAAIVKMLGLAWRKETQTFTQLVNCLNLVPVSISYEFDPCDVYKARELYAIETSGAYQKPAGEDIRSIVTGITGFNGRIHLHTGAPLQGEFDTADAVAHALDLAIVSGIRLFPGHWHAVKAFAQARKADKNTDRLELPFSVAEVDWETMAARAPQMPEEEAAALAEVFAARLKPLPRHLRPYVLLQYANVVRNRFELGLEL